MIDASRTTIPFPAPTRPRVLILSRDPALSCALFETLGLWRYAPEVFGDPSELLHEVSRCVPLAVVVDAALADADPLGVVRCLREHPFTRDVVRIAVLEALGEDALELAEAQGCHRVTTQPVDTDWVGAEIERLATRPPPRAA